MLEFENFNDNKTIVTNKMPNYKAVSDKIEFGAGSSFDDEFCPPPLLSAYKMTSQDHHLWLEILSVGLKAASDTMVLTPKTLPRYSTFTKKVVSGKNWVDWTIDISGIKSTKKKEKSPDSPSTEPKTETTLPVIYKPIHIYKLVSSVPHSNKIELMNSINEATMVFSMANSLYAILNHKFKIRGEGSQLEDLNTYLLKSDVKIDSGIPGDGQSMYRRPLVVFNKPSEILKKIKKFHEQMDIVKSTGNTVGVYEQTEKTIGVLLEEIDDLLKDIVPDAKLPKVLSVAEGALLTWAVAYRIRKAMPVKPDIASLFVNGTMTSIETLIPSDKFIKNVPVVIKSQNSLPDFSKSVKNRTSEKYETFFTQLQEDVLNVTSAKLTSEVRSVIQDTLKWRLDDIASYDPTSVDIIELSSSVYEAVFTAMVDAIFNNVLKINRIKLLMDKRKKHVVEFVKYSYFCNYHSMLEGGNKELALGNEEYILSLVYPVESSLNLFALPTKEKCLTLKKARYEAIKDFLPYVIKSFIMIFPKSEELLEKRTVSYPPTSSYDGFKGYQLFISNNRSHEYGICRIEDLRERKVSEDIYEVSTRGEWNEKNQSWSIKSLDAQNVSLLEQNRPLCVVYPVTDEDNPTESSFDCPPKSSLHPQFKTVSSCTFVGKFSELDADIKRLGVFAEMEFVNDPDGTVSYKCSYHQNLVSLTPPKVGQTIPFKIGFETPYEKNDFWDFTPLSDLSESDWNDVTLEQRLFTFVAGCECPNFVSGVELSAAQKKQVSDLFKERLANLSHERDPHRFIYRDSTCSSELFSRELSSRNIGHVLFYLKNNMADIASLFHDCFETKIPSNAEISQMAANLLGGLVLIPKFLSLEIKVPYGMLEKRVKTNINDGLDMKEDMLIGAVYDNDFNPVDDDGRFSRTIKTKEIVSTDGVEYSEVFSNIFEKKTPIEILKEHNSVLATKIESVRADYKEE